MAINKKRRTAKKVSSSDELEEEELDVAVAEGNAISQYELQRLERIKRNNAFMASLSLNKVCSNAFEDYNLTLNPAVLDKDKIQNLNCSPASACPEMVILCTCKLCVCVLSTSSRAAHLLVAAGFCALVECAWVDHKKLLEG